MIASALMAAALGGAAVALSAQARDGEPATSRELLNEIRALRAAIERFADVQTQTQTLASLMTIQQRRMADATARLDVVRRELDAMNLHFNDVSRRLAGADQMTPRDLIGPDGKPPVDPRQALEEHRAQLGHEFEGISAKLGQLRARESEVLNQAAFEEGRWRELTSRMEEWVEEMNGRPGGSAPQADLKVSATIKTQASDSGGPAPGA
jgi:hypothetical protein